jgi:hypothetical protein
MSTLKTLHPLLTAGFSIPAPEGGVQLTNESIKMRTTERTYSLQSPDASQDAHMCCQGPLDLVVMIILI